MYTAEEAEDNPGHERHGDGEQCGEETVKYIFEELKSGVAPYPYCVEAVSRGGLCNEVIKFNLQKKNQTSGFQFLEKFPILTCTAKILHYDHNIYIIVNTLLYGKLHIHNCIIKLHCGYKNDSSRFRFTFPEFCQFILFIG